MELSFKRLGDFSCRLGESATWDERTGRLWFVDLRGRILHRLDVDSGEARAWDFESEVASLGLAASGRLVLALRHEVILFDPESGAREPLATIEAERADTRLNDGKVGPDGAFWVGSMNDTGTREPLGSLYRVAPDGGVTRLVEGVAVSNGLAWSADGETMFFADSRGPWIDRWRFDRASGALSDRRRIAEPGDDVGRPDGGAADAEGGYWSCGVSARRINRFAPDGTLIDWAEAPAAWPTMPCFGGSDFRSLFVTTSRDGKSEEALRASPQSGGLFVAEAPVAGLPAWRFLDV